MTKKTRWSRVVALTVFRGKGGIGWWRHWKRGGWKNAKRPKPRERNKAMWEKKVGTEKARNEGAIFVCYEGK